MSHVTVTRTRQSIGSRLAEYFETHGIDAPLVYRNGANAYLIDGEHLTAGQAADRYLPGGFAGNFGRA
jgi:hypothetical protein